MDLALSDPQWSRKDFLTINQCHLALHCLTMANIATGNGRYLWASSFPLLALPSTYLWPREFPSRSDWQIWEKFLLVLVCSGYHSLWQPLGPWLWTLHLLSSWGYLDVSSLTLYLPTSNASFLVHMQRPFAPLLLCYSLQLFSCITLPPCIHMLYCYCVSHGKRGPVLRVRAWTNT